MYTDENIDEVLGEDDEDDYSVRRDDEHHVPDSAHDLELSRKHVFELKNDSGFSDFDKNHHIEESSVNFEQMNPEMLEKIQQEAVTRFDELIGFKTEDNSEQNKHDEPDQLDEIVEKVQLQMDVEKEQAPVSYENVIIANHVSEVVGFPLSPMSCVEPPKEKPPPPPVDVSDEESEAPELPPKSALRRLDSTKRIKKEIRKKRSDFLGIEGSNDEAYLDSGTFQIKCFFLKTFPFLEANVEAPPDMISLLQEERRLQQQLYRQSISSEADSADNNEMQSNPVDRLDKALFLDQVRF